MYLRTDSLSLSQKRFQKNGYVAACAVLLVANQFASVAMAEDFFCYHPSDVNCDQVVDGQDLAIILGSWGDSTMGLDLDGDCSVGGGDLAMVLGSWGPIPDLPGLKQINFNNEVTSFCLGGESLEAELDGSIWVDPATYEPYGFVNLTFATGGYVSFEYNPGSQVMYCGETKMIFSPGEEDAVQVNGELLPIGDVLDGLENDLAQNGLNPAAWDDNSKIMMGNVIINNSEDVRITVINVQVAPPVDGDGPGFWCLTACIACAAAITALATSGCAVLLAGCTSASAVTIGGMLIPCVYLVGACAGGIFIGGAGAYEIARANWGS